MTFCPQCGPDVAIDEEGCCTLCGGTAEGDAVDNWLRKLRKAVGAADALAASTSRWWANRTAENAAQVEADLAAYREARR